MSEDAVRVTLQRSLKALLVLAALLGLQPTLVGQLVRGCDDHDLRRDLRRIAGRAIRSVLLIGGTATARQIETLKSKPHVVVGSPGHIVELIERGKLKTTYLRAIVVAEAYLHRTGRTGRASAKGTAVSLLTEIEARLARPRWGFPRSPLSRRLTLNAMGRRGGEARSGGYSRRFEGF
jgi:hypothetical protein